jgi:hypothetical protein
MTEQRGRWLTEVRAWLTEDLREDPSSIASVKERPWGAVLRVEVRGRRLYFKAVGPTGRHELRLLADVGARSTALVPDVLALDQRRGWVLMADHGSPAVDVLDPMAELRATEELLAPYAQLQRASAELVPAWIEGGVPDRSPRLLPHLVAELLDGGGATGPLPLPATEVDACREVLGDLERACDRLATSPTPRAIDHADIHGTNVLVGTGAPRLIDWGDACVGHPFSSLLVPIEWVAAKVSVDEQADAVRRLRDSYLEPWGDAADLEVVGLAVWVGYVARALSNDQQCAGGAPELVDDAQREIVALLQAWRGKRSDLERPERLLAPVLEL